MNRPVLPGWLPPPHPRHPLQSTHTALGQPGRGAGAQIPPLPPPQSNARGPPPPGSGDKCQELPDRKSKWLQGLGHSANGEKLSQWGEAQPKVGGEAQPMGGSSANGRKLSQRGGGSQETL